jgi:hypothetical protein
MFPLLMADKLGDYIVGTAVETIETEKLIAEFEQVIVNDVYTNAKPIDDVAQNLQTFMQERGVKINTIEVGNIYNETAETKKNVANWRAGENLSKAKAKIIPSAAPRMRARDKKGSSGGSLDFSIKPQAVGFAQAQRVVLQSVARTSVVTPGGMVSKATGQFSSYPSAPQPPPT